MATRSSAEQGNSNHAEPVTDIEQVPVSVGSTSSQYGGGSENSKEEVDETKYRPLWKAALRGDWEFAKGFFEQDAASMTANITSRSETMLHIAALSAQDQFLENLVELLSESPGALEAVDCDERTALHNAVLCGRIRMVKALVKKNPRLTQLPDKKGFVPWQLTAQEASMHKEIAQFLAEKTRDDGPSYPFSSPSAIKAILDLTKGGHHDIVLHLVEQYPYLITVREPDERHSILDMLAMTPSHFPSATRLNVLEALIYKCVPVDLNGKPTARDSDLAIQCLLRSLWNAAKTVVPIIKSVHEKKRRHVMAIELTKQVCTAISSKSTTEIINFFHGGDLLYEATHRGISEIVKLCIQFFPELIRTRPRGKSLPTHAVCNRQERVIGLFLKLSSTNELSLVLGPTWLDSVEMLYSATTYEPSLKAVAGEAFQLQRELQWFIAVESWVMPSLRYAYFRKNGPDRMITFWNNFLKEHKELLEKGEKWVKDTSNSCMLVSTLITTVLFAAAFTVPGGNNDKSGVPLLLGKDALLVFAISDALGLFSSVTAILLFLAILTSRYEALDFLYSLPKKIIVGLCFLFLSLAFMLVAFAATLTVMLEKRLEWVLIPIILLTSVPVILFLVLQLLLLYQMVKSTYRPSIFHPESIWE